ncbi:MAG: aspartate-semialdehyde dehydrogenase [Acidobacteriia bacterium]|nr:aspartate-semialdehyde dehydrogenase [Terriglobia bacterium]
MESKIRVGILGATGMVGQRFVQLLENHPQFEVTALAASDQSIGKQFEEACSWRLVTPLPEAVRSLQVQAPQPPLDCDVIFSSLPSSIAGDIETSFAVAGYPVISNSSSHRMDSHVPLLIPEVNPEQLGMIGRQRQRFDCSGGFIVANPNCVVIVMAMALAPLHRQFTVKSIVATTLQSISGAGYPGVASMDITDNVLPFIAQEEEKIENETRKILGQCNSESVEYAQFGVSAQCHRVNVQDGHLVALRVGFEQKPSISEVKHSLASFCGEPQRLGLFSAPKHPLIVREESDRPQPRLDRDAGKGMSITVGRIQKDKVLDFRLVALGHNTIRGAAGAALLNAELLLARGYFDKQNVLDSPEAKRRPA